MPSANAASISAGATATALRYPETSVNHSRTNRMSRSSRVRRTNSCCRSMLAMIHSTCVRCVTTSPPACLVRGKRGTPARPRRTSGLPGQQLQRGVGIGQPRVLYLPAAADQLLDGLGHVPDVDVHARGHPTV